VRHDGIGHDKVWPKLVERSNPVETVSGLDDVALMLQSRANLLSQREIIVDDQDTSCGLSQRFTAPKKAF